MDMTASERRLSLAAAIGSIAVFGVGIGLAFPLLSLILEARGTESTLTGLSAAVAAIAVFIAPPLVPGLVRRFGLSRFMLACLVLDAVLFLLMKVFDNVWAWFPLRFGLGAVGGGLFSASEAWISQVADDKNRGRVLGIYAAVLSLGFGAGPLLLPVTGFAGWAPFVANAVIVAVAALPILAGSRLAPDFGAKAAMSSFGLVRRMPVIALAIALYGLFEAAIMALLPVYGVRSGLAPSLASVMLTGIALGQIALQYPIGWLSDHWSRQGMLRLCTAAVGLGALALPFAVQAPWPVVALLFFWGGLAGGLYPVALTMVGERFRGSELVAANAAVVMLYGLGAVAGPALGGGAMDLWNPHGLPAAIALIFLAFTAALLVLHQRARTQAGKA